MIFARASNITRVLIKPIHTLESFSKHITKLRIDVGERLEKMCTTYENSMNPIPVPVTIFNTGDIIEYTDIS